MNVKLIASLLLINFIPATYQSYGTKTSDGHYNDNMDVSAEGDAVNHPGNTFLTLFGRGAMNKGFWRSQIS